MRLIQFVFLAVGVSGQACPPSIEQKMKSNGAAWAKKNYCGTPCGRFAYLMPPTGCPNKTADGLDGSCDLHAVFADMHDGDKKEVIVRGNRMTIKPSGNNQTWQVDTTIDCTTGAAIVDFNVPGKPGPPPINLTLTLWKSEQFHNYGSAKNKHIFEFTDPSGTLAAAGFPLNRWVELGQPASTGLPSCPESMQAVFQDMHDGDKKYVTLYGSTLTIKPYGNNQSWIVTTQHFDLQHCNASVNFKVHGKPGPPPVNLLLTLSEAVNGDKKKAFLEFTDPTGTLAAGDGDYPLNQWVELSKKEDVHLV